MKHSDGTCEATVYRPNDERVAATRTRAGHWLVYEYNGRLVGAIYRGSTAADEACTAPEEPEAPQRGEILVAYIYDAAWRLVAVRSKDAGVECADFDFAGRPRTTRAVRYKNGTGLAVGGSEHLDVFTQKHQWSLFDGERLRYRMPFAGTDEPPSSAGPWVSWMSEERDAAGNLVALQGSDQVRSKSFARGVGRLSIRERPLGSDLSIRTLYGYAEPDTGQGLPGESDLPPVPRAPGPFSGMLGRAGTTVGEDTLSGTEITRDATARVATAKWLGVGNRESRFRYDDRDRLNRSVLGGFHDADDPPSIEDVLEPADFRAQRLVNRLTESERALLGRNAPEAELPSFTATRTAAQQIDQVDYRDELPPDVQFAFTGGLRTSDGVWSYKYDEFGRLTQLTRMNPRAEEASRYEYEYNPLNRMVGRRVCSNVNNEPCVLETRTNVLARDGLPNDVTFSWDPITDRLLSISRAGSVDDSGLLRQYIHGDQAYDDPLVVLTPSEAFYPVIDESGTGNLIAVLRNDGTFVERVLYGDSYGASPRYLHGPVVQRVTAKVKRDALGNVIEATFSINVSDALREATVASGARLRSVRSDGSIAFTSPVIAELDSDAPHTLRWKLNATDWNDLANASGATSIELVVTTSLRAVGWGETPVMAPPAWMRTLNLRTSDSEPFIRRESIFTLLGGGEEERTLWQIADLYLVASPESKAKVLTGFKAAPFVEAGTGFAYLRDRWYDPGAGTFVAQDRSGYLDSSNLYAGFGGDPVNNFDPTGECIGLDTVRCRDYAFDAAVQFADSRNSWKNLKRSTRFLGLELKGAAFAIPRLVKGVYDVATHLPETGEAISNLATAIANDPVGVLQAGGSALINAHPDAVGEFVGETLFLAGLGAAAKTPQVANAVRAVGVRTRLIAANPLPKNGIFARVMPRAFAEKFAAGTGRLGGGAEVFVTAADDLADVRTIRQAQQRLALFKDAAGTQPNFAGDVMVRFKVRDPLRVGLRSPGRMTIDAATGRLTPRGYGFRYGGRTGGNAREWLFTSGSADELGIYDIELSLLQP